MSRDEGMTDACGEVEKLVGACSHKGTDGVCEACVLDALRRARAEALEEAAEEAARYGEYDCAMAIRALAEQPPPKEGEG